jgi:putative membrane protein
MLFLIVTFVLCLPLVLFALSNTEVVRLGIWPTDYGLEVHLSLAILVAMAIAFLLGALVVWISELAQRRRARRAERMVRLLEAQIEALQARAAPPTSLPPAA